MKFYFAVLLMGVLEIADTFHQDHASSHSLMTDAFVTLFLEVLCVPTNLTSFINVGLYFPNAGFVGTISRVFECIGLWLDSWGLSQCNVSVTATT